MSATTLVMGDSTFVDSFHAALERVSNQEHVPMGVHSKAAPRHEPGNGGAWATCSCGWSGKRPAASAAQALLNATAHAETLSSRRST